MDFNNIAALLHDGVDPAEIAKAFTNELNQAIRDAEKPTKYQEACSVLSEAWHNALDALVERDGAPAFDITDLYFNPDEFEEALPLVLMYVGKMKEIAALFSGVTKPREEVKELRDEDADNLIAAFLRSIDC